MYLKRIDLVYIAVEVLCGTLGFIGNFLVIIVFIRRSVKGSQLDAFCPYTIVYWYLEFKLRYLKNLKLFSIRIKELSEPIVL